ncbi:lipid-A-disaccharide synthase-related protein [Leptolyngbya sp. AN02str]|uniref:lipid-A-disaccharide synthase-related protein n=1 Tax=Leptolyngbya sp. AN02str TaxID=3423363 RepID=UPI003D322EAD
MKLLCLSNGHGEDAIALRVLEHLQQQPDPPEIYALPLVGEGHGFAQANIPIIGPAKRLPSGGFIYMDSRQLARDLRGGLLSLTLSQLRSVKIWAKQGGSILAVGDIVPLLFAWYSGAPYAFIGTAKSDYYLRDEAGVLPRATWADRMESWRKSDYLPWERWLMSRPRCKAVFPRDSITSEQLREWNLPVFDLGNPMMDGLEPSGVLQSDGASMLSIVLLPGSRPPEAYANWRHMLQGVDSLCLPMAKKLRFFGAIAPSIDWEPLKQALVTYGWQATADSNTFIRTNASLTLTPHFGDCLHLADLAIAMAGTATEQFVGLGKPAIIFPGEGPQFTPAFAEAQTRLLGPSVILVEQPSRTAQVVSDLLQDPDRLHLIAENGQRRMGKPGAAARIAECLRSRLG